MAKPTRRTYWRVRYMLKGKPLAEVQVEAVSEAQALAVARSQVKVNIRRLADDIVVEKPRSTGGSNGAHEGPMDRKNRRAQHS